MRVAPQGIVRAIVAVSGVADEVNDIIIPGAMGQAVKRRRAKVVEHHDWQKMAGKVLHVEEMLPGDRRLPKLTPSGEPWPKEAGALVATMQYNLRVAAGRDAYEWVKFYADSNEAAFSLGYKVIPSRTSTKNGIRYIGGIEIFEFSSVLHGAHPLTMALEVKGAHPDNLEFKVAPAFSRVPVLGLAASAVLEAKGLPALEVKAAARAVLEAKALIADDMGQRKAPNRMTAPGTRGANPAARKTPGARRPPTVGKRTPSGRASRAQDPTFKEELHPRAPMGEPNGGQFVAKGDGYKSTGRAGRAGDVRAAQAGLIKAGTLGANDGRGGVGADGLFGAKTEAAVKAWQKKNGHAPTGKLTREQHAQLTGKGARAGRRGGARADSETRRDKYGRPIVKGQQNAPVGQATVTRRGKPGGPPAGKPNAVGAPGKTGTRDGKPYLEEDQSPEKGLLGGKLVSYSNGHANYSDGSSFSAAGWDRVSRAKKTTQQEAARNAAAKKKPTARRPAGRVAASAPGRKMQARTERKSAWDTVMEAKGLHHDHVHVALETKAAGPKFAGLALIAADTGRVLMLQRALTVNDPAAGCWEFPGGGLDGGEKPYDGAVREWEEETGLALPHGNQAGHWDSGPYRLHAYVVPVERDVPLNVDHEDRDVPNPDDPNGTQPEVVAWWDLRALAGTRSTAIRAEVRKNTDWAALAAAAGGTVARRLEKKHLTQMESKGMEQMAGSFEALRDQLGTAVRDLLCKGAEEAYACIEATMPDHVIASCHRDGKQTTFQIDFTQTPDGVQLGEPQEVTLSVVAMPADGETEPATAAEEAEVRFTAPAGSMLDDAAHLLMVAPLEGKQLDALQGPLLRLLDAMAAKGLDVAAAILGDDDEDDMLGEPDDEGLAYDGVDDDEGELLPLEEKVLLDPDDIAADIASLQEGLAA